MTQSVTDLDTSPTDSGIVETIQLVEITKEFLESMFGIDVTSFSETGDMSRFGEAAWRATIKIEGETNAEVEAICCASLARRITSSMFCMESEELGEEELSDAIGEVVNIVGGNIKGAIQQENRLSLPCVAAFSNADLQPVAGRVFIECDGGFIALAVSPA